MAQLYAKIHTSILTGSLVADWKTRHVFMDMLLLADEGVLDMHRTAFAAQTGIPIEIVNESIEKLESPDPESRDPENDGRRIKRLDSHRNWGWEILNWDKYSQLRTRQDNSEKERGKKRAFRKQYAEAGQAELTLPLESLPSHSLPLEEKNRTYKTRTWSFVDLNKAQQGLTGDSNGTQDGLARVTVAEVAEEIWALYPKKVAKPDGLRAIIKAIGEFDPVHILKKTSEFATFVATWAKDDKGFVPNPATWFNSHRFNDDPSTWDTRPKYGVRQAASELPIWQKVKILKQQIDHHQANPEWAGYLPERTTKEMKADFDEKVAKLAELEQSQVS